MIMCQTLAQSHDNVSDVGSVMIMSQTLAQSDDNVSDVGSVMIMCQSWVTCLCTDCCFSELTL
jgi:hypothetical protein